MSRKTAREVAMKLAFARLFGGEDTYEAILEKSGIEEKPTEDDMNYSDEVLCGIEEHSAELDEKIAELAIGWSVERMPKVDLSILRVALYEMMYMDKIPSSVSINEAVELAKRFDTEDSYTFVNGVLGAAEKLLRTDVRETSDTENKAASTEPEA